MSGRSAMTAGDLLTLPELRGLRRTCALLGAGLVVHAWAVIDPLRNTRTTRAGSSSVRGWHRTG